MQSEAETSPEIPKYFKIWELELQPHSCEEQSCCPVWVPSCRRPETQSRHNQALCAPQLPTAQRNQPWTQIHQTPPLTEPGPSQTSWASALHKPTGLGCQNHHSKGNSAGLLNTQQFMHKSQYSQCSQEHTRIRCPQISFSSGINKTH